MTPTQLRDAIRAGIRTAAQAAKWKQDEARRQRAAIKATVRGMI